MFTRSPLTPPSLTSPSSLSDLPSYPSLPMEILARFIDGLTQSVKASIKEYSINDTATLARFNDRVGLLGETATGILTITPTTDAQLIDLLFQTTLVVEILISYHRHYSRLLTASPDPSSLRGLGARLGKVHADISYLAKVWLAQFVEVVDQYLQYGGVVDEMTRLLRLVMELVVMDRLEEAHFLDNADEVLLVVQQVLLKTTGVAIKYFGVVVAFLHVVYQMGQSHLVVELLGVLLAHTGIEVLQANATEFNQLVDYYRYMAFNLVQYRIMGGDHPVDTTAFFTVLLSMPHISLDVYTPNAAIPVARDADGRWQDRRFRASVEENLAWLGHIDDEPRLPVGDGKMHIQTNDRREIAWLYCISYLLEVRLINKVVDSSPRFQQEADWFVALMTTQLSNQIIASSQPSLNHPSLVNMTALASALAHPPPGSLSATNRLLCRLIGAIFHDNLYKERLVLLVNFIKAFTGSCLLQKLLAEGDEELEPYFMRFADQPGKLAYLNGLRGIVRRISRLLREFYALTVKNIPEEILVEKMGPYTGEATKLAVAIDLVSLRNQIDELNHLNHKSN